MEKKIAITIATVLIALMFVTTVISAESNGFKADTLKPQVIPYYQCKSDSECNNSNSEQIVGLFCKFENCDSIYGNCKEIPQECTEVYQPVCGCNGKTYPNECGLDREKVRKNHDGECKPIVWECRSNNDCYIDGYNAKMFCEFEECSSIDSNLGRLGKCTDVPVICSSLYAPVCGCDGITYANDCLRQAAMVSKNHDGVCYEEPKKCFSDKDCTKKEFCEFKGCLVETGKCTEIPKVCPLDYVYQPVCGCDGKTYSNECTAHMNKVSINHKGKCEIQTCEHGKTLVKVFLDNAETTNSQKTEFCIKNGRIPTLLKLLISWSR